ncbi:MAG: nickel pincer cofactor biosynthesis protein LarC [Candidatus Syntrophoarchaeum sp. WYZ-LMO15]|nr:MAG: nickel pincer cofactor biosynthesis protein LarC [Candidatus Syntrophoarchaeum sp. WYZ-LMO15]
MRSLLFDPFSGASGDMILASLIDLGVDLERVRDAVRAVCGDRVEIEVCDVRRHGIAAKQVVIKAESGGERRYPEIVSLIEGADLDERIKTHAISVFELMADAESRVHGVDKESLVLHDIGQLDAIADVIGSVTAILELGLDVSSTRVMVGGGFFEHHHGTLPSPAPATLEILRRSGLLFGGGPIESELLTPTGAAILGTFVSRSFRYFPHAKIHKIGYGAGSRDHNIPNVLRAVICDLEEGSLLHDAVEVLETTVDDITGEVLGGLIEALLREGALDASIIPVVMKKGRPGHTIQVIVRPEDAARIAKVLIRMTGTLGVRVMPVSHRLILKRRIERMDIFIRGRRFNPGIKIAEDLEGEIMTISPEFDDCRKIAEELGLPVREVLRVVESEAISAFCRCKNE